MSQELPAGPDRSRRSTGPLRDYPVDESSEEPGPRQIAVELGGGTDWRRYRAAVSRHKWLVVLLTALGAAGGILAARFVNPEYSAEATIWIETASGDRGPIRAEQLLGASQWVELLQSYVVLDYAVRELKLYLDLDSPGDSAVFESFDLKDSFRPGDYRLSVSDDGSAVALATDGGVLLDQGAPGDSLGGELGFAWVPTPRALQPGKRVEFTVVSPRDAARSLGNQLETRGSQTRTGQNGNFLRVELVGTNPSLVAATVNSVVERTVEVAAELKRAKLTELATILGEQLARVQRGLHAAEIALETFRIQTITLPSESPVTAGLQLTQGPVMESFFNLRIERDQLAQDRAAIVRGLDQARDSGFSVDAFEVVGAVQRSTDVTNALAELTQKRAELRALRYSFTLEHPDVRQLEREVRELEQTSLSVIGALVAELAARQAQLDARIQLASHELEQIPPRAIQEARLRRDVAVAENLYTTLQMRYEEARLGEAGSTPDLRILDMAVVPERAVRNPGPRFILMGLATALGVSLIGAVMLDRMDRRIHYPDQVTEDLGLPLLSVVPHFHAGRNGARAADTAPVVEALRAARLNLVYACGTAGPLIVTVTSPGPGDGKSFIASNLALAFAEAGHRTLLVDGDVRRGALHRVMNASRKPGLMDLVRGNASRAEVIQETAHRSLFFLGSGTRTADAPELLGSESMIQLVTELRSSSRMEVVIVDSPPLASGVDAFTLATLTGNVLLVLRLGMSDRELAGAKLDVLDRLPVRVLGAILNDVRSGAAYYYHSYYLEGYEHENEEEREVRTLIGSPRLE